MSIRLPSLGGFKEQSVSLMFSFVLVLFLYKLEMFTVGEVGGLLIVAVLYTVNSTKMSIKRELRKKMSFAKVLKLLLTTGKR